MVVDGAHERAIADWAGELAQLRSRFCQRFLLHDTRKVRQAGLQLARRDAPILTSVASMEVAARAQMPALRVAAILECRCRGEEERAGVCVQVLCNSGGEEEAQGRI